MREKTKTSVSASRRRFTAGMLAAGVFHHPFVQAATNLLNEPTQAPASPTDKLVIYQIFTRLFGNPKTTNKPWGTRTENGVGKFNDITETALRALKNFGASHVWYTGVIQHATMTDYSANGLPLDNPWVVKGRAGSPYAIRDYYDVDPDLAVDVPNRMREFENLLQRTHAQGLKVLIDFVPNHVARQYRSLAKPAGVHDLGQTDDTNKRFDPQNNFYYLPGQPFQQPANTSLPPGMSAPPYVENPAKATGNDVFKAQPSPDDWYETVKLNYGIDYENGRQTHVDPVPSTWLNMRDILVFWAKKGVDGFRCDVAEMVPVAFWGWVIPQVKAVRTGLVFIAEIYNPQQYQNYVETGKFDYLYDKVNLYDALRPLMESKGTTDAIDKAIQYGSPDLPRHMLRFLENHDEQRIASRFFAGDPFAAVPAMTVAATLHTGPMMVYFGQEVGVNPTKAEGFQGDDGRTTIFDYWGVPEFQAWTNLGRFDGGKLTAEQKKLRQFYQDLIHLVNSNDAIQRGQTYILQDANRQRSSHERPDYDAQHLYSYLRYSESQKLLIVCNFDKQKPVNTRVQIPDEAWQQMKLSAEKAYVFQGIFGQTKKTMAKQEVPVVMPPLSALVLAIL